MAFLAVDRILIKFLRQEISQQKDTVATSLFNEASLPSGRVDHASIKLKKPQTSPLQLCGQPTVLTSVRLTIRLGGSCSYHLENVRFLLLSTNLAREWLHIDTDLLRIITSTADVFFGGTNIDDLERP